MKKFLNIAGIVAALLVAVWVYRALFPGDEKRIRRLLAEVAETAEVKSNENPIFRIAGANKLAGYFSPDAVLRMDVPGVDSRELDSPDNIRQAFTAARAGLQEAKFQVHELKVTVADSSSATAQFVGVAYLNGSGDPLVQEFKMQLRKIDNRWKISRVETVKTLGM